MTMQNDLGQSDGDPCRFPVCLAEDVNSWMRLHEIKRQRMETLLEQTPAGPMRSLAAQWYEASAIFDYTNLQAVSFKWNSTHIDEIIASIRQEQWLEYQIKKEIFEQTPEINPEPEGPEPEMGPFLPPEGWPVTPEDVEKKSSSSWVPWAVALAVGFAVFGKGGR